jgi:hypothetical protein
MITPLLPATSVLCREHQFRLDPRSPLALLKSKQRFAELDREWNATFLPALAVDGQVVEVEVGLACGQQFLDATSRVADRDDEGVDPTLAESSRAERHNRPEHCLDMGRDQSPLQPLGRQLCGGRDLTLLVHPAAEGIQSRSHVLHDTGRTPRSRRCTTKRLRSARVMRTDSAASVPCREDVNVFHADSYQRHVLGVTFLR